MPSPAHESGFNAITLCFSSWVSYKPRMFAFAVQRTNYSYDLIRPSMPVSLSVPSEKLVDEAMYFGTVSGRNEDKLVTSNAGLTNGESVPVPRLSSAIAAIEGVVDQVHSTGDHILIVTRIRSLLAARSTEPPLVSVAQRTPGFEVLRRSGQHRLAVPTGSHEFW
ncbi:flavin reductase family protein [Gordonia terrae]